jgi:hypothetical protein
MVQKTACGYFSVTSDCTPSDTLEEGMQPNGLTLTTMCALRCFTLWIS